MEEKNELVVSCQVVINSFCGLSVTFCGFISHLIGRETINIPEIFSGVHGFTGKTVNVRKHANAVLKAKSYRLEGYDSWGGTSIATIGIWAGQLRFF